MSWWQRLKKISKALVFIRRANEIEIKKVRVKMSTEQTFDFVLYFFVVGCYNERRNVVILKEEQINRGEIEWIILN